MFEGDEADKSQHGPPPNPLLSHTANMRTSISRGRASCDPGNRALNVRAGALRQAQEYMDLNINELTKRTDRRRTRIGYKDQMKRDAFAQMQHVTSNLKLHDAVQRRAQVVYAGYRDILEQMHEPKAVVAACMLLAIDAVREEEARKKAAAARRDGRERAYMDQVAHGQKTAEPKYVVRRKKIMAQRAAAAKAAAAKAAAEAKAAQGRGNGAKET